MGDAVAAFLAVESLRRADEGSPDMCERGKPMASESTAFRAKSLDVPDETRPFGSFGRLQVAHIGGVTAVRATFQPGFRWTDHVKPVVGTDLCQVRHVGYVISGRSGVRLADGTERELAAGDVYDVPPGHDAWVIGDEPYVTIDFSIE
jgi:hypothetical protein